MVGDKAPALSIAKWLKGNPVKEFVKGTIAENAPIIPVSAHHDVNLDILISAIEQTIPTPDRDAGANGLLHIARSFDINRPGARPPSRLRRV